MSDIPKWLLLKKINKKSPSFIGKPRCLDELSKIIIQFFKKATKKKAAQWLKDYKRHNESSALVLAIRGTLLTASPLCQSKRTVLCVAEVLGHWIPCFSDSLLRTDPERCCSSLGSPTVNDIHLLFSWRGAKMGHNLTHFNDLNPTLAKSLKWW